MTAQMLVEVSFRGVRLAEQAMVDVRADGLFVHGEAPLPVGSRVMLCDAAHPAQSIAGSVVAVVERRRQGRGSEGITPGMLLALDAEVPAGFGANRTAEPEQAAGAAPVTTAAPGAEPSGGAADAEVERAPAVQADDGADVVDTQVVDLPALTLDAEAPDTVVVDPGADAPTRSREADDSPATSGAEVERRESAAEDGTPASTLERSPARAQAAPAPDGDKPKKRRKRKTRR